MASDRVEDYYTSTGLGDRILAALQATGADIEHITVKELAPADQFHSGGLPATLELARLAGVSAETRVVDVGCGIGGPARALASEFGCSVTGVDLTLEFVRTAEMLTRRTGLDRLVSFRHASALEMPFEDGAFDITITQHASMNIADKAGLYREIHRVLRPGGRFAFADIHQGAGGEVQFPMPWARDPSISFLATPEETRALLTAQGFIERHWADTTAALKGALQQLARGQTPPPGTRLPSAIALVLGEGVDVVSANLQRAVSEDRLAVIQGVFERP